MDRIAKYREVIRRILEDYASPAHAYGQVTSEIIVDPIRDHYELMDVGWDRHRRIHGLILHLDIIDGKIWVQHDGTNRPVVDELEAAGVPKEDIVLAFQAPHLRQHSGYAVG